MKLIHQPGELASGDGRLCVALGMFDGVHLGHQQVLSQTVADAGQSQGRSVAITFDRHPDSVVAPERTPLLIYSLPQRLRAIEAVGIQTTWVIHFDRTFSQQLGETFVTGLTRDLGEIQSISIGSDFTFGHKRSGNVALLRTLGAKLGFQVHDLPAVQIHGKTISSTRIRELIQEGNIALASELLGRPYAMAGPVLRGRQLGQQLGFPTANLDIAGLVAPPRGVYAGEVLLGSQRQAAVANIGYRPTLNSPEPALTLEVHLLDFSGDLYRQELEFKFGSFLRPEVKFSSLGALREQIQKDVTRARAVLG